jgi:hypothetical protein
MEDLIKQLSEVNEESPAFDRLMVKLEIALNSNYSLDSLEEIEVDGSWIQ